MKAMLWVQAGCGSESQRQRLGNNG